MKNTDRANASIIVTGGAGFIGSEFIRNFYHKFKKTYIIDSLTYSGNLGRLKGVLDSSQVEFIQIDINRIREVESIFKNIDYLVHFAAETHVDRSIKNGFPFINSNINGTYEVLNLTHQYKKIRTVLVSTDEVYGSIEVGETDEYSPIKPSSVYSASKAAADLLALAQIHTHNQDIIITRCCNNYGPYQELEKFIPNTLNSIINGNAVTVYGSGNNVREWIHVSDHCHALFSLLKFGKSGHIYNIGSGRRFTNIELVELLFGFFSDHSGKISFVPDRKGHDLRYALNSDKVKRELGWSPKITMENGLQQLVENFKSYQRDLI